METRRSPLKEALEFERAGKKFFSDSAKKAGDPLTRELYEYLAQMETKHMEEVIRISKELEEKGAFPNEITLQETTKPADIFLNELKKISSVDVITDDDVTVLRTALNLEVRGREMYETFSKNAEDEKEARFYELLAEEEQRHFEIIYQLLEYFENKGLKMGE